MDTYRNPLVLVAKGGSVSPMTKNIQKNYRDDLKILQTFRTGMEKIRKIWIYEVKGFNRVFKRWYIGIL